MSKSLEELQREYEENTARLEQEKRKLRRLENRKSYLALVAPAHADHGVIDGSVACRR